MLEYHHACRATQGARHYQEDSAAFLVMAPAAGWGEAAVARDPAPRSADPVAAAALVAVLADGMGGHAGGAVASRMVCDGFIGAFGAADPDRAVPERLSEALDSCNGALADKVAEDPMLSGMGSTVIGALFSAEGLEWVSVGDSPLYLYRRGEVAQLNEDHSLAPELDRLAAAGRISRQEAQSDPRRHMLRSAVTGEELTMVDLSRQALQLVPGDYVILASDGVQTLETDEIARLVGAYAQAGPEAVAEALIRAVEALRVPHQDNATVVVVRPVFD